MLLISHARIFLAIDLNFLSIHFHKLNFTETKIKSYSK